MTASAFFTAGQARNKGECNDKSINKDRHRYRSFPRNRPRLAQDGFAVVVNYAGNAAQAEEAVEEIKAAGGQGIAAQADRPERFHELSAVNGRSPRFKCSPTPYAK
jgi:hypothetical protein